MSKLGYNLNFWIRFLTRSFNSSIPNNETPDDLLEVDYYCKTNRSFSLINAETFSQINIFKHSGYTYDLYEILFPYAKELKFRFLPGDIRHIPDEPTFVKSRPITDGNENSILLPLDSYRHFKFVDDQVPFLEKKDGMVWRGAAYQPHRIDFLRKCSHLPFGNFGNTAISNNGTIEFERPRMSIKQQLSYKFVVSIEGNDVATNLKWIMSSNSVCFMPKPKFETWYKEGTLVAGKHYVEIADDYSDLEKQYFKYLNDPVECKKIISQANAYSGLFQNKKNTLKIARLTVSKYLNLLSR